MWGHWEPDSGCEVHRRYCFPRAEDSKVVTGEKKHKRTHWSRWKLNIHTEYLFLPNMEITCSYLFDVELSDFQFEIHPHDSIFSQAVMVWHLPHVRYLFQHSTSVQFTSNKNLEVLMILSKTSIDFPYDDHSYMIFPYGRYESLRCSQASEEEQEKAKQLIKATMVRWKSIDDNLIWIWSLLPSFENSDFLTNTVFQ